MAKRVVLGLLALMLVVGAPAPVSAQAAPGPFVKQAFDLLMDRFVVPPTSAALLGAAWEGGVAHATSASGSDLAVPAPSFTGNRGADWNAFLAGYPALVAAISASADQHALDRAIVRAMANSLNSTHTFLADAPFQPGQRFAGIGVQMSSNLVFTTVHPGTPAEAAGVRRWDRLVAIGGESVEGMPSDAVSSRLRGPAGSTLQIAVRRAGTPEPIVIQMMRAEIVVPWVQASVVDGDIGVLRIIQFPPLEAIGQFDAAVATLEGADVKALVVDLRDNGGGSYETNQRVANRFIPEGALHQELSRNGQTTTVVADGSAWGRRVPVSVLVNARTGSASELLSSALRENDVANLVGMPTRGGVAGGRQFPLADGSTLTIAVVALRSGKGEEIEHVGLEPDLTVDLDMAALAEGRDTQMEAALAYLKRKLGQ